VTSALNTPDDGAVPGAMRPGTNAADAPIALDGKPAWFLHCLGDGFTVVAFGKVSDKTEIAVGPLTAKLLLVGRDIADPTGLLAQRYGASPGTTYLFRPDQYVAARWSGFDEAKIADAMLRASGHDTAGRTELAA
jgi:3-(3-hydroxy-phenyl)propionate hydroxylase